MKSTPGGFTRPKDPPSIFPNVPSSCLSTPKPPPRPPKDPNLNLQHFLKKDKISSFEDFSPDKQLKHENENECITRTNDRFVCMFMSEDFRDCQATIIVHKKNSTLFCPLTVEAYKMVLKLLI